MSASTLWIHSRLGCRLLRGSLRLEVSKVGGLCKRKNEPAAACPLYRSCSISDRLSFPIPGVYDGIGSIAIGSAPGAALFFLTYEGLKDTIPAAFPNDVQDHWVHVAAASIGEATACCVRVPTELVKSHMQTGSAGCDSVLGTVRSILDAGGGSPLSLYRGFGATLLREVPFSFIQFPIYEALKGVFLRRQGFEATGLQGAICGSIAGAVAAATTTPLDVVKTRLMLGKDGKGVPYEGFVDTSRRIVADEGGRAMFKGIQPRVAVISLGGFVFFGAYEYARALMRRL